MAQEAKDNVRDVEVTSEMIDAGIDELWGFRANRDDYAEVLTKVYRAMRLAAPEPTCVCPTNRSNDG